MNKLDPGERRSEFDCEENYVPSSPAVALSIFVVVFAFLIVAVAIYEIADSGFWEAAPMFLHRILES